LGALRNGLEDVFPQDGLPSERSRKTNRDFIRDPVMLEFLGSTNAGSTQETNLEQALIHQLQAFLLELELRAELNREQAAIEERLLDQVPL
jgi:predicted nuclease of restriction endonuclease-like (RecB) superfamily